MVSRNRLALLCVAGLAFFGGFQLIRGFTALFAPVSTDYSEMMVAGMAQQLLNTGRLAFIYAPPDAPYAMPGVQYPPLFMVLTTLLMKFGGLEAVLASRLLTWGGYAAAGALVGLHLWRETGQRFLAVCTAFFPFTFWSVIIFINGARPDSLALFLSLFGVYLYRNVYYKDTKISNSKISNSEIKNTKISKTSSILGFFPSTFHLLPFALILVLAFYSKQTYLAAAAAIFFDLLLTKNRRIQALFFGLYYAIFAIIGFALCQALSDGQFAGIFEAARAGRFIFHLAPAMVGYFLLDHAPIIILALISLVWQWRRGQRFWPLYLFFAALACSSIVKDGAVDYYFNELAYLLALQAGLLISRQTTTQKFSPQRNTEEVSSIKYQVSSIKSEGGSIKSESSIKYQVSSIKGFPTRNPQLATPFQPTTDNRQLTTFLATRNSQLATILLLLQMLIAGGMVFAWNQWKDNDNFGEIYQEARAIVQDYQQSGRSALVFQNNFLIETGQTNLIGDYFIYWILIGNGGRDIRPFQADLENRRYDMILVGSPEFRRWSPVLEQALQKGYQLRILSGKDNRPLYWLYTKNLLAEQYPTK